MGGEMAAAMWFSRPASAPPRVRRPRCYGRLGFAMLPVWAEADSKGGPQFFEQQTSLRVGPRSRFDG